METTRHFDVIIIGGSYSGLAAGMALGRALQDVLIIDSGKPCNAQTPHSHNFLTRDGQAPAAITHIAKEQVRQYPNISFFEGVAVKAKQHNSYFEVEVASNEIFAGTKLIFATGIRDMLPAIEGLAECWGISVLHCPFCHGYEVRNQNTGIFANGISAFELATPLSNWTNDLTIFTNGTSTLTGEQATQLAAHQIHLVETPIARLEHKNGMLTSLRFEDETQMELKAAYIRSPFRQACLLPEFLGCALTDEGYIQVDGTFATSIPSVYACGDNVSRMRTVANAVASGTATGITVSRILAAGRFQESVVTTFKT